MTDFSNLSVTELCARMVSERDRVHGPDHYRVWYDRGWYRTSKGNAYRRPQIEQFLTRFATKADWDGQPEPEEEGPGLGLFRPKV